ncbi:MAG TPA: hypothetical protein VHO25_24885 [Polyangiaceae bacterium]|nr:hypothetical protein [Polyangiaceae bacterium]
MEASEQITIPKLSEEKGLSLLGQARTLRIADQQSYGLVVEVFDAACQMEAAIKADFETPKSNAHKLHKSICDLEKKYLGPVSEAKELTSRAIGSWDAEQKRLADQEQKRLEAEALRRAEVEAEQAALDAIDQGATEEEVAVIAGSPAPIPRITVAPSHVPAKATSSRWSASPKGSNYEALLALVKAAAANPEAYLICLEPAMPEINRRAQRQQQAFNVPGFEAKPENKAVNRAAGRKY